MRKILFRVGYKPFLLLVCAKVVKTHWERLRVLTYGKVMCIGSLCRVEENKPKYKHPKGAKPFHAFLVGGRIEGIEEFCFGWEYKVLLLF